MNNSAYKSKYLKYKDKYLELKEMNAGMDPNQAPVPKAKIHINPEDFINSFLIIKGVRDAYLLQNHKSTTYEIDNRINAIQTKFPELNLLKNNNYYYFSLKKLTLQDIETNEQISKILRFSCDVEFDNLNRNIETVTYNFNVYLQRIKDPINIITYICQTKNTIQDANKLLEDIKTALSSITTFEGAELNIKVNIPVISLIPKLIDISYVFTQDEIEALDDIIYNIMNFNNYNKIIGNINYYNPIHRGIVLAYISDFKHPVLEPLYPLNTSGYMEDINRIEDKKSDLIQKILIDSN